ncbi:NADP-dependent malic enzyme, mitochondrial isoform X2 [Drosophila bipectinata]|uniref:NADP-dependent malic enzyme, mitochondrial isoform X2 n=1 Tax=Drosophila bipectinata TaxID=42026 RepID=UPI0038B2D06D
MCSSRTFDPLKPTLYVSEHVTEVLPIIYTPTVGMACLVYGMLYRGISGVYITKYDCGHMVDVLLNWPDRKSVKAICVTDGQRILGLGDLGANGMGICVGKMELYTALGGISPEKCLPVCLDVGTTNANLREDPMYIGLREDRLQGKEYEDFIEEFIQSALKAFGCETLIHFEDFATPNAFKFLKKYQDQCCYFNDDIQGTAAVGLAGLLGIQRITKIELQDHVILFCGAGSAVMGLTALLKKELKARGLADDELAKNIYVYDHKGLITKKNENIPGDIADFAKDMAPIKSLEEVVEKIKPSIIMGATSAAGLFTEKILRSMAKNHERPGVFAFSNPTNKAECTAEQAYNFTEGRAIYSAGSPFPPVEFNGKRLTPGQANNCFAFPGIVLGVMTAQAETVPDEAYLVTAHTLSNIPSPEDLASGKIYPDIGCAKAVALEIAIKVCEYLFKNGLARLSPEPEDIREHILKNEYQLDFCSSLPETWEYPEMEPNPKPKPKPNPTPKEQKKK